LTKH